MAEVSQLISSVATVVQYERLKQLSELRRRKRNALLAWSNQRRVRRKRVCEFLLLVLRSYLTRTQRRFGVEPGRTGCLFWENTVSKWNTNDSDRL